jgi:SAM-dependent methyltransferase
VYDETRGGIERGLVVAELINPWLPAGGGPVVEVGVGTGVVAKALSDLRGPVFGVDLSLSMLVRAAQRLPGRVVAGDAMQLPLPDGRVAAVYFVHVLHLVADIAAVFGETDRVLSGSGRLVVVVNSRRAPDSDLERVVIDAHRRVRGERPDQPDRVIALAGAAGFTLRHRDEIASESAVSPSEVADSLERRMWSWTWGVDDAVWTEHMVPAIATLRSLSEPDRPRETVDWRSLLVFDRCR